MNSFVWAMSFVSSMESKEQEIAGLASGNGRGRNGFAV